jgi:hypothetical protein
MKVRLAYFGAAVLLIGLFSLFIVPSGPPLAQHEVTSKIYRYRERVATGYYEGYEVSPRRKRAVLAAPGVRRGLFPYGSSSAIVRIRTRLPDSHAGLKFYYRNTCIECHPQEARNIHSVRAGITCHYYSAMNPIRRHSYVCAKCHEGANAAFAGFYVHEPAGTALSTKDSFPVLFYTSWGMLLLLLGTLAFFVPHSFMVGLRELFEYKSLQNLLQERISPILKSIRDRAFSIIQSMMAGLRKFFEKKKAAENEAEDAP